MISVKFQFSIPNCRLSENLSRRLATHSSLTHHLHSSTYLFHIVVSKRNDCSIACLNHSMKRLATIGLTGDHMAATSTWEQSKLLHLQCAVFIQVLRKSLICVGNILVLSVSEASFLSLSNTMSTGTLMKRAVTSKKTKTSVSHKVKITLHYLWNILKGENN